MPKSEWRLKRCGSSDSCVARLRQGEVEAAVGVVSVKYDAIAELIINHGRLGFTGIQ